MKFSVLMILCLLSKNQISKEYKLENKRILNTSMTETKIMVGLVSAILLILIIFCILKFILNKFPKLFQGKDPDEQKQKKAQDREDERLRDLKRTLKDNKRKFGTKGKTFIDRYNKISINTVVPVIDLEQNEVQQQRTMNSYPKKNNTIKNNTGRTQIHIQRFNKLNKWTEQNPRVDEYTGQDQNDYTLETINLTI